MIRIKHFIDKIKLFIDNLNRCFLNYLPYYVETIGSISEENIKRYIEEQSK